VSAWGVLGRFLGGSWWGVVMMIKGVWLVGCVYSEGIPLPRFFSTKEFSRSSGDKRVDIAHNTWYKSREDLQQSRN
jgi:hypothetical protein